MNQTERSSVIAIVLCIVFYVLYSQHLSRKYGLDEEAAQNSAQNSSSAGSSGKTDSAAAPGQPAGGAAPELVEAPLVKLDDSQLRIETDTTIYRFSQTPVGIGSVTLKKFNNKPAGDPGSDSSQVELLDGLLRIRPVVGSIPAGGMPDDAWNAERNGRKLKFFRDIGTWRVEEEIGVPETGYGLDIKLTYTNTATTPLELNAALLFDEALNIDVKKSGFSLIPGQSPLERARLVAYAAGSDQFIDAEGFCHDSEKAGVKAVSEKVEFVGFDHHYFITALAPRFDKVDIATLRLDGKSDASKCRVGISASQPFGFIQPGQAVSMVFAGYLGPKIVETMEPFSPRLKETLNLGWLDFVAQPLLAAIKGLEHVTGNYGIAIICVTLLLKLLFYPLTRAAAISMHKMKKLNPEMAKIRERFKDNPQAMHMALRDFMVKNKVNPAKGCFPILPQIPVFFAFYRVLSASIELRHAVFFGWIHDLAASDPYFVTPVLLGVGMFVQQRLTPMTGVDKTQERIMMFMPIMFSVMMLTLPAGLVIYMLTNTVVSIAQQQWLNRKLAKLD